MEGIIVTNKTLITVAQTETSNPFYVKHHEDSGWFLEKGISGDVLREDSELNEIVEWLDASREEFESPPYNFTNGIHLKLFPVITHNGIRGKVI